MPFHTYTRESDNSVWDVEFRITSYGEAAVNAGTMIEIESVMMETRLGNWLASHALLDLGMGWRWKFWRFLGRIEQVMHHFSDDDYEKAEEEILSEPDYFTYDTLDDLYYDEDMY